MKAMFVNENGCIPYAEAIAKGYKPIETRSRNMLKALVGERVAVVKTRHGKSPVVVGYVDVVDSWFCPASDFEKYRDKTCIPAGSSYDVHGKGKWFYILENAKACNPYPLPGNAIRHGRSWCEF